MGILKMHWCKILQHWLLRRKPLRLAWCGSRSIWFTLPKLTSMKKAINTYSKNWWHSVFDEVPDAPWGGDPVEAAWVGLLPADTKATLLCSSEARDWQRAVYSNKDAQIQQKSCCQACVRQRDVHSNKKASKHLRAASKSKKRGDLGPNKSSDSSDNMNRSAKGDSKGNPKVQASPDSFVGDNFTAYQTTPFNDRRV